MKEDLLEIFKMKTEMLCNGLQITEQTIEKIRAKGIKFDFGRRGGAGPAGGRYFKFINGSIVNTPLYHAPSAYSRWEIADISEDLKVQLVKRKEPLEFDPKISSPSSEYKKQIQLEISEPWPSIKLIPTPEYYTINSSSGILLKKIALLHGDETIASTIQQKCCYWRGGQQCKFCGIELSLKSGATIEQKSTDQLIEAIKSAQNENPNYAKHITLTIGTQPTKDKGMAIFEKTVSQLKAVFPDLQIHIQIEPMQDIGWYRRLKNAGTDTIGIHLEILDDEIRKEICPGKSKISKEIYFHHWKEAINVFDQNQVSSFIITGFEPDLDRFLHELEKVIKIGVVPLITPVRIIPGTNLGDHYTHPDDFFKIVDFAAKKCLQYGVNPLKHKAGCIRCGGCSPLLDAYRYLTA
ncbi:MAG: radical SAM protein [Promethearchaeota archaeon]